MRRTIRIPARSRGYILCQQLGVCWQRIVRKRLRVPGLSAVLAPGPCTLGASLVVVVQQDGHGGRQQFAVGARRDGVHRAGGVVVGGQDGVQAVGGRVFGAAVHLVDDGGFLRCAGCATLGRRSVPIPERLVPALKARLDGRSPDAQIS
jgi:hypothetical protein